MEMGIMGKHEHSWGFMKILVIMGIHENPCKYQKIHENQQTSPGQPQYIFFNFHGFPKNQEAPWLFIDFYYF